jgi:hypothetical protein
LCLAGSIGGGILLAMTIAVGRVGAVSDATVPRASVAHRDSTSLTSIIPESTTAESTTTQSAGAESPDEALQRIVFRTPLARFRLERSRAVRAHRFDATTDGCSAPLLGSRGRSFNFRLPCERHDFAYRNYLHLAGRGGPAWDAALRAAIDDQFQRDLQSVCSLRRGSFRLRCDAWVIVYFHAVRLTAGP